MAFKETKRVQKNKTKQNKTEQHKTIPRRGTVNSARMMLQYPANSSPREL